MLCFFLFLWQAPTGCSKMLPPVEILPIRHSQPGLGSLPWQQVQPCTLSNGSVQASVRVGGWGDTGQHVYLYIGTVRPITCLFVFCVTIFLRSQSERRIQKQFWPLLVPPPLGLFVGATMYITAVISLFKSLCFFFSLSFCFHDSFSQKKSHI